MSTSDSPCRCWVETWSQHDGHCCFAHDSPEDCHNTEGVVMDAATSRNGCGGSMMARRYWLTDKGWAAVGGRSA